MGFPSKNKKSNSLLGFSVSISVLLAILLVLQVLVAPLSSPLDDDNADDEENYQELNEKYNALESENTKLAGDLAQLQSDHDNLQTDYTSLQKNNDNLVTEHNQLQADYLAVANSRDELNRELEFIKDTSVGHLMECGYVNIREVYEEKWEGFWWNIIGDDDEVIEFAANLAQHDLGRVYWTDANERYYAITGENMHQVALSKLSFVPDYVGIEYDDDPVTKVEKILDFVTTWVHYEHDINEVFLSPVEALTFRSGDCDDFAILVSALFELVGLDAGIVFVTNDDGDGHAMTLLHLEDLGSHGFYYFSDLTDYDLQAGRWILIEPQSPIDGQANEGWMSQWTGEYFVEIE